MDKNLICSRDPRDIPVMSQALVDRFAESGGLNVASRQAQVLIVLPAATNHQRWVFDRLSIFGISPVVWSELQATDRFPDARAVSSDMLVILDGAGTEQMNSSKSLASMVDSFMKRKKAPPGRQRRYPAGK